jgi:hypothetical protein
LQKIFQIKELGKNVDNCGLTQISLITFNNEVTFISDTSENATITGDKLNSWKELQVIGANLGTTKSVKDSKQDLLKKLWNLEEGGATALGPALLLGITVAGARPRSKVILCTDGLANAGIGSLEGKKTDYTPFYTELAEQVEFRIH